MKRLLLVLALLLVVVPVQARYLGDIGEDATISFTWNTSGANGQSITRATDGTVKVLRVIDAQDATGTAVTDTEDTPDTGVHTCIIDTSDNATFLAGYDYTVWVDGAVIDGQTVNATIATFSIENRIAAGGQIAEAITGRTIIAGDTEVNTYASAATDNGTRWSVDVDAAPDIDLEVDFALGARKATEVEINGYFNGGGGRKVLVYAYNYALAADELLASGSADTEMRHRTSDKNYLFPLTTNHTDTDGSVKISFKDDGGVDGDTLYLDRLVVLSIAAGTISPESVANAVWVHTDGNAIARHTSKFTGKVWYVDNAVTDDLDSGVQPDNAFKTIGTAISNASAGDRIIVKAGTYTETGIDMNLAALELWGEIGTIIDPASGSALTISATHCYIDLIEVRPAAGEIGFDIASGSDHTHIHNSLSNSTGGTGYKIDSGTSFIVITRSQASEYTSVGVEVNGAECLIDQFIARGNGGTETGFKLNHTNAHRNLLNECSSIDNATLGFQTVVGADDNQFQMCTTSAGDGGTDGRDDQGANNAWRGYMAADLPPANVTAMAANVITAASIANNAIGATEVADDALDAATFAADYWVAHTLLVHPGETVWYVSKDGNDGTGDGTAEKPELTIGAAVTDAASGDTIFIGPGTYSEQVDLATVTKSLTLQGAGIGKTIVTQVAQEYTIALYDYCTLLDLKVISTHADGKGVGASNRTGVRLERVWAEGPYDGFTGATGDSLILKDCIFKSTFDGGAVGGNGFFIEGCYFYTDCTYSSSAARACSVVDGEGVIRSCVMHAKRADAETRTTVALEVGNARVKVENCIAVAEVTNVGCAGFVVAVKTGNSGAKAFLSNCKINVISVGSGTTYDIQQLSGAIAVVGTDYDSTDTSGTITQVPPDAAIQTLVEDIPTTAEFEARTLATGAYFLFGSDTVANVGTVATLTGHTVQTGDNFARIGAPAGASISADIAAIKAETVTILADTNELQTDWADGGRLDLALDSASTGGGSTNYAYTLTSTADESPIGQARVEVYTSSDKTGFVTLNHTNNFGVVVFDLDPGTYYFWRTKSGFSFTNPHTRVVP